MDTDDDLIPVARKLKNFGGRFVLRLKVKEGRSEDDWNIFVLHLKTFLAFFFNKKTFCTG